MTKKRGKQSQRGHEQGLDKVGSWDEGEVDGEKDLRSALLLFEESSPSRRNSIMPLKSGVGSGFAVCVRMFMPPFFCCLSASFLADSLAFFIFSQKGSMTLFRSTFTIKNYLSYQHTRCRTDLEMCLPVRGLNAGRKEQTSKNRNSLTTNERMRRRPGG